MCLSSHGQLAIAYSARTLRRQADRLSGKKMQALAARRLQMQRGNFRIEHLRRLDPGCQLLFRDVLRTGHAGFDHHIVDRGAGTHQDHAGVLLGLAQHIVMCMDFLDFARNQTRPAFAAIAVAATVVERYPGTQRGFQKRVIALDGKFVPAGLYGDLCRHDPEYPFLCDNCLYLCCVGRSFRQMAHDERAQAVQCMTRFPALVFFHLVDLLVQPR
jgi:hypothetical protein